MLLLDENLSPRLIARIAPDFPECLHVIHAELDNSPDTDLWSYARTNSLAIVTKDKDFLSMLSLYGSPPKIIHLTTGNTRVAVIENLFKDNKQRIYDFLANEEQELLAL